MVEVNKPDYLSLVNKSGSGFNVSELVDSIVASEIEPKRILQTSKKEKTENAISGVGFLTSQANTTKNNFNTISGDKFFEPKSTNEAAVSIKATDEMVLDDALHVISDIDVAKKMVFELGGFTSLTETFSANLTIDYGEWSVSPKSVVGSTNSFSSGKTYKVTQEIVDPADVAGIAAETSWNGETATIPVGTIFTVNDGEAGVIGTNAFEEIDGYDFQDANALILNTLNFEDKTLNQIAALINGVGGIQAQVVDTIGDGSNYSLVLTSTLTGAKRGFKITGEDRWSTLSTETSSGVVNNFSSLGKDATFKLDGVQISRNSNEIDDLIEGATISLNSDYVGDATIGFSRSDEAIKNTVNDVIFSLNEFKSEIDRLTYIDIEGDENGPLAMDPSATSIKTQFKRLSVSPLTGYGDTPIYLSNLGIKSDNEGNYFLDEDTFQKTLSNNPDYFLSLKDDNISSNSPSVSVSKSEFTSIDSGTYSVSKSGDQWTIGDKNLLRVDYNGGSRFTSTAYPGLVIVTAEADPTDFNIYVGKSFSSKVDTLMADMLDFNSSLNSAEESYKNISADIETRLKELEEREKLITNRYTQQFGKMEQSMTQFNSTKTLLDNFIEAWKKQK